MCFNSSSSRSVDQATGLVEGLAVMNDAWVAVHVIIVVLLLIIAVPSEAIITIR